MTYADLYETLTEQAAYDLEGPGLDTDEGAFRLLKLSADRIAKDAEIYAEEVGFSPVAGQRVYPLDGPAFDSRIYKVLNVYRDGLPLWNVPKGQRHTLRPASGQVTSFLPFADGLILYPTPSDTETAIFTVDALVLPAIPLADGSNETLLPDELEQAVVDHCLAVNAGKWARTPGQAQQIQSLMANVRDTVGPYRRRGRERRTSFSPPIRRRVDL